MRGEALRCENRGCWLGSSLRYDMLGTLEVVKLDPVLPLQATARNAKVD